MEITPLLLLCEVSACSLDESSSYTTLLELFGGRRKEGMARPLLLPVWCLELAGGRTLCMGAPGGLYRPTPRGYNGNPTGHRAQPSVTALASFCAATGACRLVGPASFRPLGRQAGPTVQGLVGGWLLWLHLGYVGFVVVGAATVPPPVRRPL